MYSRIMDGAPTSSLAGGAPPASQLSPASTAGVAASAITWVVAGLNASFAAAIRRFLPWNG